MPFPRRLVSALAALLFAAPALAQSAPAAGGVGAYLAAGVAVASGDYRAADTWYARALAADPANQTLTEGAMITALSLGDIPRAAAFAATLRGAGSTSQNVTLALLAEAALRADYAAILAAGAAGQTVGPLMDDLLSAWASIGGGQMNDGLARFDTLATTAGIEGLGLYHKALALAQAGDFEGAAAIFTGEGGARIAMSRRAVVAYAQIMSQAGRGAEAADFIASAFAGDGELDVIRAGLAAGQALPFTAFASPRDGLAEAFLSVATALNGEMQDAYTLLHARIAAALRPDDVDALLLVATLLERQKQYDLAIEVYAQIPPSSPAFPTAEIGRAEASFSAGRGEAAIEILAALARAYPANFDVQIALGNGLRRAEQFAPAIAAYDAAIALVPNPAPQHWAVFFSRGIAQERTGDFVAAEVDMRRALALNPDQPQVLNYLGYSLVDRGVKLDEALAMIETAVSREPNSGYIIDSLAWAYYRLGRAADALAPMEKASLLEPVDPIVTDHLGDVYWANGRQREARFQWRRALSFAPADADALRIRAKLDKGLDAVLASEGAGTAPAPQESAND